MKSLYVGQADANGVQVNSAGNNGLLKRTRTIIFFALLVTLLLAGSAALEIQTAWSQVGSGYAIPWMSVDGGVGQSSGGNYAVMGTIGQADAGELNGGVYDLYGGFGGIHYLAAGPLPSPDQRLFLPLVLK